MNKREIIKQELLNKKSGVIEFRCYFPYRPHKRYTAPPTSTLLLEPRLDKITNWYIGVEKVSKEVREGTSPFVDPDNKEHPLSSFMLEHGKTLDLAIEENRLVLKWLLECDEDLALTYDEGKDAPGIKFFIHDEILDVQNRTNKLQLKDDAIKQLALIPDNEIASIARIMGYRMDDKNPSEIRLSIRELFETPEWYKECEKFIRVSNDNDKSAKMFLLKALDKGVIERKGEGTKEEYYYKEIFLANKTAGVIAWFRDPENKEVVIEISQAIGEDFRDSKKSRK